MGAMPATLRRATPPVLAISPHLDDAVLACGGLLATLARHGAMRGACKVVTVFAAWPPSDGVTEWDCAGGFGSSREALRMRRHEDRRAVALLGARHRWLNFVDSQYGSSPSVGAIARRLAALCRNARTVLFPLGLFHSDHRLVHEAMLRVMRRSAERCWLVYEDALYRRLPGLCQRAVARLRRLGFVPQRMHFGIDASAALRKSQAVACYASQLRALATPGRLGHRDAAQREGYWRLSG